MHSRLGELRYYYTLYNLLHSLSIELEDRYIIINHWKKLLFNDDNRNGGNKLRTYRKLKNS